MLQGAISKSGSALLLAGPPGYGKSALLRRLGERAARCERRLRRRQTLGERAGARVLRKQGDR
jgi:MoxR-like ATPase